MLEVEKYSALWSKPEYRLLAPGEEAVASFINTVSPKKGETVIDFGCGTGRGANKLKEAGLDVIGVDFTSNCLDPNVDIRFEQHDLTHPIPLSGMYGFCTDVMEHIPPGDVDRVLRNITKSAKLCYFQISCIDDVWGKLIGEPLHLSIHNAQWWKEAFERIGAKVLSVEDAEVVCRLYVTSWADATEFTKNGRINVGDEKIRDNIRINSNAGYQLVVPHHQQDVEVMLIGGGPSLKEFEDDIRAKRESGVPLITTNGSYNWAVEKGLRPSAQIVVDAREFNKKFLDPIIPGCKYLIASQCDPSLLEAIPKDQLYLWHSVTNEANIDYVKSITTETVFPIPGGSTVMLRAIPLLRLLGFPKFHIYGFDSCVMDTHHSYAQPENDQDIFLTVKFHGKEFTCAPWMISQAEEFKTLAKRLDDDCQLAVYGDGLIATIIRMAAEHSKD